MRQFLFPLAAVFAFIPAARADDAADAKAIIEKAIKARGGKFTAMTWKDEGKFTAMGFTLPYTADWAFQAPNKYRFDFTGTLGDAKINLLVVVDGAKAWGKEGNRVEEITGEKLEYTLNEAYLYWVTSLTPLVSEKGFTLATAKGKDVNGKPTNAVKVTRDKRPPVTLYFDKDSGLLVKYETMIKDEFQKWKEVLDEAFMSEYKDVNGMKCFTKLKIVRDGKTVIESTLSEQKPGEKLDAKLFAKPE